MSLFAIPKPGIEHSETRKNLLQGVLVGSGFAGAGTVVFGAIELIRSQPDKAFKLLETWGPWFFLAMFAVWAANGLMNRGVDVAERLGERFADSVDRIAGQQEKLAESQERLAVSQELIATAAKESAAAQQQVADKDNREQERMATLVEYSGQQSRQALEAITVLSTVVHKIAERMDASPGKG